MIFPYFFSISKFDNLSGTEGVLHMSLKHNLISLLVSSYLLSIVNKAFNLGVKLIIHCVLDLFTVLLSNRISYRHYY